jgi:predicted nucleotidyltransferase
MKKDQAIAILRQHEAELRQRGVRHAALFGSVARGEADDKSDIDIAVRLDPAQKRIGIYEFVGIQQFIASLFAGRVDVIDRDWLKPYVKKHVEADIIDAF